jgi:hypothetical protein
MPMQINTVYHNEEVEDILFPGLPSGETYIIPEYVPKWNANQNTFSKQIKPANFTVQYMSPDEPGVPYPGMMWVDTDAI